MDAREVARSSLLRSRGAMRGHGIFISRSGGMAILAAALHSYRHKRHTGMVSPEADPRVWGLRIAGSSVGDHEVCLDPAVAHVVWRTGIVPSHIIFWPGGKSPGFFLCVRIEG